MLLGFDFSLIALIGIILLVGIVKKNAIMMIDFARDRGCRRTKRLRSLPPASPVDHDDDVGSTPWQGASSSAPVPDPSCVVHYAEPSSATSCFEAWQLSTLHDCVRLPLRACFQVSFRLGNSSWRTTTL
jgi:hypothetical protein